MKLTLIIYGVLLLVVGRNAIADDGTSDVSRLVTKYSVKYNVEREILSCVLFVESSYRIGLISDTEDYGMAQVNVKTARMYNLELTELLTNTDYSINAAARILSDYKRAFKSNETNTWPARYNIGYQSRTTGSSGAAYVAYNTKLQSCITSNKYL